MAHVFISYSKTDIKFARYLKDLLESNSFPVWMDEKDIQIGKDWKSAIEQNIVTCSAFIVIMSETSRSSEWCSREVDLAQQKHKPIFPVLKDGEVWFELRNLQYVDMSGSFDEQLPDQLRSGLTEALTTSGDVIVVPDYLSPKEKIKRRPRFWRRKRILIAVSICLLVVAGVTLLFVVNVFNSSTPLDPNAKIVFIAKVDGQQDVWFMQADRSGLRRFTNDISSEFDPSWSPDASKIVFASDVEGNYEIYTINFDGQNRHRLTNDEVTDGNPVWSPDGTQVAFVKNIDGNDEIYVIYADGSFPRNLTNSSSSDYAPSWSPDGTEIAFWSNRNGNSEIYVMNIDGTAVRRLTDNGIYGYTLDWSPNGKYIVFDAVRTSNYDIYVMNSDGTNQRKLTDHPGNDAEPNWSLDGQHIIFVSERDGNKELYVMDTDGTNQHNIMYDVAPDFNPDLR